MPGSSNSMGSNFEKEAQVWRVLYHLCHYVLTKRWQLTRLLHKPCSRLSKPLTDCNWPRISFAWEQDKFNQCLLFFSSPITRHSPHLSKIGQYRCAVTTRAREGQFLSVLHVLRSIDPIATFFLLFWSTTRRCTTVTLPTRIHTSRAERWPL